MKMKKLLLAVIVALFVVTLTACGGSEKAKYTVTFNSNGGSAVESVTLEEGKTVTKPANPTREMYDFVGWYSDAELTAEYDFTVGVSQNITLYAKWNEIDPSLIFTITYELDGGTLPTDATTKFTNYQNVKLPTPTKKDYSFDGWYEGETKVEALTENRNYELVAKWSDNVILLVESVALNKNLAAFANKDKNFIVQDEDYLVGDDNEWRFEPVLSVIKYDKTTGRDWSVAQSTVTIKYQVTINEIELDSEGNVTVGSEVPYYEETEARIDSVDLFKCTINFGAAAVGQYFRVTVLPELTTADKENPVQPVSFDVKVVDGWNIYSAAELAYIENRAQAHDKVDPSLDMNSSDVDLNEKYMYYLRDVAKTQAYDDKRAWDVFKAEKIASGELQEGVTASTFILQTNITVTKNDIPSYFFWTEGEINAIFTTFTESEKARAIGSLKDYAFIYTRDGKAGETLNIFGNYFTLNTSNVPLVVMPSNEKVRNESDTINSHSTLFRFDGSTSSYTNLENIKLLGNAKISNEAKYSGGLIQLKNFTSNFRAYNNISICYYITYMADCWREASYANVDFTIDSCYATDSYNSFIYNWGNQKVKVINSTMLNAGGPVIIQDHVINENDATENNAWDQAEESFPSYTEIIDSDLRSMVAGTEGWFITFNATETAALIKVLDAKLFNTLGKTILQTQKKNGNVIVDNDGNPVQFFNLVAVQKSGEAEGMTATLVKGSVVFSETNPTDSQIIKSFPFGYDGTPFGTEESSDHQFYEFYENMYANHYIVQSSFKDEEGNNHTAYLAIDQSFNPVAAVTTTMTPEQLAYKLGTTDQATITAAYTQLVMGDLAKGDHVAVYIKGMGVVFGYTELPQ